jgi:osmotically-inducible protein OsmY/sporulation protein YlmC with PRC-barrel domain
MTESQVGMAVVSSVKPTTDKWQRVKQIFLNLHQDHGAPVNDQLTATIMRTLGADQQLGRGDDVAHLRVIVNDGIATLTGHVVQPSNKVQAEAAVRATSGVTAVVNRLVVDIALMIEVAQALGHDQQTQAEQIQVNVQHGVVYLGGTVNRPAVRAAAAQIAASIPQVRGVINVIKTAGFVIDTDEERFVQPQIGGEIYATDGQVGRVQQVIINPQNRRVTALVVQQQLALSPALDHAQLPTQDGQAQHAILIPITSIRRALSGALFLNISSDKTTHFASFNAHRFAAPPVAWQPPFPYRPVDILFSERHS